MFKTKKRRSLVFGLLLALMIAAVPAVVYADDEYPLINLPGKDVVADGTEEAEQQGAPAYSYSAASRPETADYSDTVPYMVILAMSFAAALVYRQNIIVEKRNFARDEHDAEMEDFRTRCRAARLSE